MTHHPQQEKPKGWLSWFLRLGFGFYRYVLDPLKPKSCRFYPTCSAYAEEALRVHGVKKGMWLTLKRLVRCHPWGGYGVDLVPEKDPPASKAPHAFDGKDNPED